MTTYLPAGGSSTDAVKGKTIILPSVSLANLPQLTADLLITSLGLTRLGYIGDGSTVVPFFGADRAGPLTGGLEAYGKEGEDAVVIQQRSPTIKEKKEEHVDLIRRFIDEVQPASVLVLASLDAANQDDVQLQTPHQHLLAPNTSTASGPLSRLSTIPSLNIHLDPSLQCSSSSTYPPFLPGAGLTRRILASLGEGVPHGTILAWCVEGDNRGDAHALAKTVLGLLEKGQVEVKEPDSWRGLFGSEQGWSGGRGADAEIYG